MAVKYYRVKKDNPMWKAGAIIKCGDYSSVNDRKYQSISDIWDQIEGIENFYEGGQLVENSPDWYERVYELSLLGKVSYATKEVAQAMAAKMFKEK